LKKLKVLVLVMSLVALSALVIAGCQPEENNVNQEAATENEENFGNNTTATNPEEKEGYVNARYRGIYDDRGENQVTVQFYLEDDHFSDLSFRQLKYDDIDYEDPENIPEDYIFDEATIEGMGEQYRAAIEYLEGEHVSALSDLQEPGNLELEPEEVDGMTAATIRGSKIVSAVRDALNRGEYDNIED